jgi:hypothetical protein
VVLPSYLAEEVDVNYTLLQAEVNFQTAVQDGPYAQEGAYSLDQQQSLAVEDVDASAVKSFLLDHH